MWQMAQREKNDFTSVNIGRGWAAVVLTIKKVNDFVYDETNTSFFPNCQFWPVIEWMFQTGTIIS